MKITILTLFPSMIQGFLTESIVGRAQRNNIVAIDLIDLRKFATDNYGTVDDKPYGGGAGMILRADVVYKALSNCVGENQLFPFAKAQKIRSQNKTRVILTSAKGATYSQAKAEKYSKYNHLVIICGHYEGVDERVMAFVDDEISIGQFVLTGGELPSAVIADSVARLLPGVFKKADVTSDESFSVIDKRYDEEGAINQKPKARMREYPHYTRPIEFMGMSVPSELMSGNHSLIAKWREDNRK
jgi:tRNA (guanine37-N1)-methyltransferase